jgi:ubiquinone/menaquinone biosynthesis C-methylase UbiE
MPKPPASPTTDLYDSHYGSVELQVYRDVRAEAFGEDLGQTSWITAAECDEFGRRLSVRPGQHLLEIACGSGRVAVRMAKNLGIRVTGVDVNEAAIAAASRRAAMHPTPGQITFQTADANERLAFSDGTFDAVFCNDAVNHLRDRTAVLSDWFRVLRRGGRCLYTDPVVVTGPVSNDDLAARSSIGFFLFLPTGANERCLRDAGFSRIESLDATEGVSNSSRRWHDARAARAAELTRIEGADGFVRLQQFLSVVHRLAGQRRLSRIAFIAEK